MNKKLSTVRLWFVLGVLLIFGVGFTLLSQAAEPADCRVAALQTIFHHESSYDVNLTEGIRVRMEEKNFKMVLPEEEHHYEFDFIAEHRPTSKFDHAYVKVWVRDRSTNTMVFTANKSKRCFTQSCAVYDFRDSFVKAFKEMKKELKKCRE